ncbi:hypothetical protein Sfin5_0002 [Shigella phage Sfin-5]|uniref:Uncharacterized protein n=3 Tax=Tunavirus Sfin1 TaxID=2734026 RepID=A0A5Q2EZQ5_9CAUD|nr:hypothetical protein Sfin4_0027 [Shigella phage Sfin-4]QGF19970.1 hypothetical protein Sfin5_0002 [Shigella phage Sfin-5]QGZ15949.1 hypothetical protein Sfin6_0041 [Shigella phage Sfin-6]
MNSFMPDFKNWKNEPPSFHELLFCLLFLTLSLKGVLWLLS